MSKYLRIRKEKANKTSTHEVNGEVCIFLFCIKNLKNTFFVKMNTYPSTP